MESSRPFWVFIAGLFLGFDLLPTVGCLHFELAVASNAINAYSVDVCDLLVLSSLVPPGLPPHPAALSSAQCFVQKHVLIAPG